MITRTATAADYDLYHSLQDSDYALRFQSRILEAFPKATHPRVLDFGCGRGHALNRFLEHGHEAHGVDCSAVALAHAVQHLGIPASRLGHLHARTPLPFPEGSFELVFSADVLEHLPAAEIPFTLAELVRVCTRTLVLSICFRPAQTLAETGLQWHPTVQSREWWNEQLHSVMGDRWAELSGWRSEGEPNLFVYQRQ